MAIFNVDGIWYVHQQGGTTIKFDIQQTGTELKGIASYTGHNGTLEGRTLENQFLVKVKWNDGSVGEYSGTFNINGRIIGITFAEKSPGVQATWVSKNEFQKI